MINALPAESRDMIDGPRMSECGTKRAC